MSGKASPFERWWTARVVADRDAVVALADCLKDWLVWCGRTGTMPGLPSLFYERLCERAGGGLARDTTHVKGVRLRRADDPQ